MTRRRYTKEEIMAELARRKALQEQQQQRGRSDRAQPSRRVPRQAEHPTPSPPPTNPPRRRPQPESRSSNPAYKVDPRTNKKYRVLKPQSRAAQGNLSSLRARGEIDENIQSENLAESAKIFLGHLQVPPDREEMARLRKLKAAQRRRQEAEYEVIRQKQESQEARGR